MIRDTLYDASRGVRVRQGEAGRGGRRLAEGALDNNSHHTATTTTTTTTSTTTNNNHNINNNNKTYN